MPRQKKKYNERIELGRSADGTRIRKWIRADTKAELEALRRQAYKETVISPSATCFGEYAQKWLETYKPDIAMSTKRMYDGIFGHFEPLNKKQIASITATDLQEIIKENRQYPTACKKIRTTLIAIFRAAIRDGIYTGMNPAIDLELPKIKHKESRYITDEEMEKILACQDFTDKERLYIDVLRYTGMRPSEGLALKYDDVSYKEKLIHVSRSIDYGASESRLKGTKTGKDRDIPLNSKLATVLKSGGKSEGFVFLENGEPPSKAEYNLFTKYIMHKIDGAVGYDGIIMYSFRHTFATFLFYKGVRAGKISTKKAAQIMGHSEKVFISTYTHIDDTQEQALEIVEEL